MMKKRGREYISDSKRLPGWVWVSDAVQGFSFLMPKERAREERII